MIHVALYLFTALTLTAGLLGHPPVLASLTHRLIVWALQRAAHGRHRAPVRPTPSWAREGGKR